MLDQDILNWITAFQYIMYFKYLYRFNLASLSQVLNAISNKGILNASVLKVFVKSFQMQSIIIQFFVSNNGKSKSKFYLAVK